MITAIFADVGSVYTTVKATFSSRIDYGKILNEHSGDELIEAIAYGVQNPEDAPGFVDALKHLGYITKFKEAYDWHVELTVDAIRIASKIQRFILITDDQAYVHLIKMIHSQGVETIVYTLESFQTYSETPAKVVGITEKILESGYVR